LQTVETQRTVETVTFRETQYVGFFTPLFVNFNFLIIFFFTQFTALFLYEL